MFFDGLVPVRFKSPYLREIKPQFFPFNIHFEMLTLAVTQPGTSISTKFNYLINFSFHKIKIYLFDIKNLARIYRIYIKYINVIKNMHIYNIYRILCFIYACF